MTSQKVTFVKNEQNTAIQVHISVLYISKNKNLGRFQRNFCTILKWVEAILSLPEYLRHEIMD
jgi:hypothetical protein